MEHQANTRRAVPRFGELRRLALYLPQAARLVWTAAGWRTIAWFLLLVVEGALPGAVVYLTKLLLNGAQAALGQGLSWENAQAVLIPAILMGSALVLTQLLAGVTEWLQAALSELVQDHVQSLIHKQTISVDLALFNAPGFYNQLQRASSQAGTKSLELMTSMGAVLRSGVTLVAIAAVLLPYGLWVPAALVLSGVPALIIVTRHNRRLHAWSSRTTEDHRRLAYFNLLLTMDVPAAEMRLLGLGAFYKDLHARLRRRLRGERLALVRRQELARLAAACCGLLVIGLIMAWMIGRALTGTATLGDLGLFYQAFNQGQTILRGLMGNVGRMYTSALFLEDLFSFLEIRPAIVTPPAPEPLPAELREGIRFEDVAFRYPGAERPALSGFSVFIPAGKVVAIVGPNGAGKSTLVKLVSRLYDPAGGTVSFDGVDLRDASVDEIRARVAVMFQEPMRYQMTAADNIAVGDVLAERTPAALTRAAEAALIRESIEALPEGYNTQLGNYFAGGVELSGGQWQRVSLARAFYRQAPIVVLDEPTSAMDAWAEHVWLQQFGRLVQGRTAVIITHRFTTAMHADLIHVMNQGRIIESGTHDELLRLDGYYAESWKAQIEQGWRVAPPLGDEQDAERIEAPAA